LFNKLLTDYVCELLSCLSILLYQFSGDTPPRQPGSTEQLRNSLSIASLSASGVNQQQHIERTNPRNAWKTPLSTL